MTTDNNSAPEAEAPLVADEHETDPLTPRYPIDPSFYLDDSPLDGADLYQEVVS